MIPSKESVLITNYTQNFWTGCWKLSDGCKFCHRGQRLSDATFNKPTKLAGRNTCIYSDLYAIIKHIQIIKEKENNL